MDIYERCFQVTALVFGLVTSVVATTSGERTFSSMKPVKTELRKRMIDEYLNDSCICYVENELFQQVFSRRCKSTFSKDENL
ncbi:hypothetical protein R6Q57_016364 [Mikania cordata]